jgi:hypothetical protein
VRFRCALLICLILCASAASAVASVGPVDDYAYDRAKDCRKRPTPGALALVDWLENNAGGSSWGIMRIDLWLATDDDGNEHALARRMGIQEIIWKCRSWWSGSEGMGKYSACFTESGKRRKHVNRTEAHKDHIHIGLSWAGARKRTSFWQRWRQSE